jgi:hypothetical protein
VEYENLHPDHKYLLDVTGRTGTPEGPERLEHEIESKLIVGRDITNKLDVAFNWINETNVDTDVGSSVMRSALTTRSSAKRIRKARRSTRRTAHAKKPVGWEIKEVKLGGKIYGGLGDSTLGLTLDPNVTQQYAGLNLKTEWTNGLHVMVRGAAGPTKESER